MDACLTIGMVAGEISGDNLAAPLIREIKQRRPDAAFSGIGGPGMLTEGFNSLFDMERLSVNGFVDPVKRLPELIKIFLTLRRHFLADPPAVFIGIDFNFFNLLLEQTLHKAGIPTVHYVSPTIWAWRQRRIKKIAKAVDMMLTLYPFEIDIYRKNNIKANFVGHPLADAIPFETDVSKARAQLGYQHNDKIVAILPGSRGSEVKLSGPDFLHAADLCYQKIPELKFVIPSANPSRQQQIEALVRQQAPHLPIRVLQGNAQAAMACADVVLVNSGTATLEALLLKRPMVMSYRLGKLTYAIVSRMTRNRYFALPNILADKELVPEFIQDQATPERLSNALLERLQATQQTELLAAFREIHLRLRQDSAARAAEAVLTMV
ncbi:MAG: lipid-A-disaccharide synthase [Gammaproteobacteria bacterium]|nr:lipid-A-disaccharide synthase [Gammaproteobacteria bacterium]